MVLSRRHFALAAGCALVAPGAGRAREPSPELDLGMRIDEAHLAAGRDLLKTTPSIDIHSHAGQFFMQGAGGRTALAVRSGPPFLEGSLAAMRASGVSAVMISAVADHLILESSPQGLKSGRPYAPGEAFADYQRQVAILRDAVRRGLVAPGLSSADIRRAHRDGVTAGLFAVEGGDFIEDRLDRIAACHADGVRSVTIIHYNTNQIGDPQTASPTHGGLSALGRDIVRRMNRTGVLIDLAHASLEATRQAVEISTQPMIISHSNLTAPGLEHPRLISLEHARLVTERGGLIGALPAGAGQTSFSAYVDTLLRMIDLLGVDHVAIGTDMDFTFKSVLPDYGRWPLVPAALLARGVAADEVRRVMGENFLRVFQAIEA
jgi:membrane dipeptidase